MTAALEIVPAILDRIRRTLVGLRMPRALEVLDRTVRQLERGEVSPLDAIDTLLAEELTVRESRRIKTALVMARLTAVKTLAGFDFSFQPSLDRNRVLTLAQLEFIDRNEVLHVLGPPGTGKSHLAVALGVEAVKAGRSVYFSTLADIIASLAKAEREGCLRERIRWLGRAALLIVDEIGSCRSSPAVATYSSSWSMPATKGVDDPHLQPRLRRMGRRLRRPGRRHGAARSAPPSRRRHPDRGIELPPSPARRPRPGTPPLQRADHTTTRAGATPPRSTTEKQEPRSTRRLITDTLPTRDFSSGSSRENSIGVDSVSGWRGPRVRGAPAAPPCRAAPPRRSGPGLGREKPGC